MTGALIALITMTRLFSYLIRILTNTWHFLRTMPARFLNIAELTEGIRPQVQNGRMLNAILPYMPVIRDVATKYGLDPLIMAAMVLTESGANECAMRFEPGWRHFFPADQMKAFSENVGSSVETEYAGQQTSWGLMQVMGTVAREHGFKGWFPELCVAEIGLEYGAIYLKSKVEYADSIEDAIAAYNTGTTKMTKGGFYVNQVYVDRVMRYYRELIRDP